VICSEYTKALGHQVGLVLNKMQFLWLWTIMNLKPYIKTSLLAVIIMLILYSLTSLGYMGPNPIGQATTYNEPLVVPAGYAFAIWSIIYTLMIAFPIYHWFKKPSGHAQWKSVHRLYSMNIIANGLWLVCASYSWQILTVLIILFMLYTLVRINDLLIEIAEKEKSQNYWFERLGFSLYFAWITLASALNISTALAFYGFDGFGINEVTWSIVFITVVASIATLVFLKYKDRAYAGVVIWAFIALTIKQFSAHPFIGYVSIIVIVVFTGFFFLRGQAFPSITSKV